ncbi:MAG: hypothetical protein AB7K68_12640 [Bacteriovoracia bacterium]
MANFSHAGKDAEGIAVTDALSGNLIGFFHVIPLALLYFSWTVLWPIFLPAFLVFAVGARKK